MTARPWILAALITPGLAHAEGGGGVSFEGQYLPRYGDPDDLHEAPGGVGCIGGVGYGVTRKGMRVGGEGVWCKGRRDGVSQVYGGLQLGHWQGSRRFYWSAYAGLGAGSLTDATVDAEDPYRSLFLYAKPTFALGWAFGFMALELGMYAQLPVNVVQWVGDQHGRGFVTPQVGVGVSVLFGDFRKDPQRPVHRCTGADCPSPSHPRAVPPPHPPHPGHAPPAPAPIVMPGEPGWQGPGDAGAPPEIEQPAPEDDAPLAIPEGGAPG